MEKRAIYAILLTFFIIIAWTFIQSKLFPQAPSKPQTQEERKEQVTPTERAEDKKVSEETRLEKERVSAKPKVVPSKEVTIETQNYWAVFTSEDARLKHFKLKKYIDRVNQATLSINFIQLVKEIFVYKL